MLYNCFFFIFSYTEYRGSIVIVRKIEIEMFTNLDVLHLPESEKLGFVMLSVGRSIYFSLSFSLCVVWSFVCACASVCVCVDVLYRYIYCSCILLFHVKDIGY